RCGDFDSIGTTTFDFYGIQVMTIFRIQKGWIMVNPVGASMLDTSLTQSTPPTNPMTFISVKSSVASSFRFIDNFLFDFSANTTFFMLDPNSDAGSLYTIKGQTNPVGGFYQTGTDITINSVGDNGSGEAEFTTATPHGLTVGLVVVNSAFAGQATYNGTFVVTDVDTPVTGTTFDVAAITFTATDTGNMNKSSLDSTTVEVIARDNRNSADSQTISESLTDGTLVVDGSGGISVAIVDVTPNPGDWVEDPSTERFSVDTATGIVTYNGITPITGMIKYSLSASQTSGAAQTIDFTLNINGTPQAKSTITIVTAGVGTPVAGVYSGGNFTIVSGDTFQLFKENTTNTNDTDIVNATLLINRD
ncbi:MAG: hypothetical protein ACC656_14020, partial [Candidatus Heimdallarchaeota archaeon]